VGEPNLKCAFINKDAALSTSQVPFKQYLGKPEMGCKAVNVAFVQGSGFHPLTELSRSAGGT
jgi:hypothetical protein